MTILGWLYDWLTPDVPLSELERVAALRSIGAIRSLDLRAEAVRRAENEPGGIVWDWPEPPKIDWPTQRLLDVSCMEVLR